MPETWVARCAVSTSTSASISAVAVSRARSGRWPPRPQPPAGRSARRRASCADSSRSMTSSTISSRSPWRQRRDLVLQPSSSLGGDTCPASSRFWSRSAQAHLVDVALGLLQLALEVALLGLDDHQLVAQRVLALRRRSLACSGRWRAVGQLGDAGVQVLDVEQTLLVGAGAFRAGSWSAPAGRPRVGSDGRLGR